MNITHYIAPRQTGKTTKAIEIFHQFNSPKCYIVTQDNSRKQAIKNRFGINSKQILLPNEKQFCGREVETLIIDEYLGTIKNKALFWHYACPAIDPYNNRIFLLSTPNKKYTKEEIDNEPYLFLSNPHLNFTVNLNVIHTIRDPERHGFRRINRKTQELMRNFFLRQETFDCELLGLYMPDQNFDEISGFYIPKPKIFDPKSVV